jgi:hypothetical protein
MANLIAAETNHDGAHLFTGKSSWNAARAPVTAMSFFFGPFDKAEEKSIGLWSTLAASLLILLGSVTYGWVFVSAHAHALTVAGDAFIRAVFMGIISGVLLYVTSGVWTYDADLPILSTPELNFANFFTLDYGIVTSLVATGISLLGYLLAGAIVKEIGGLPAATALTNTADTYADLAIYWFAVVVIAFSWLFNRKFIQDSTETATERHRRGALGAAIATFAVTVAFYGRGLRDFSAGTFLTAYWAQTAAAAYATVTTINVDAWWGCFGLFVGVLAAGAIYVVIGVCLYGKRLGFPPKSIASRVNGDYQEMKEPLTGGSTRTQTTRRSHNLK